MDVQVAEMCGLRSSVFLGAMDGPVVLVPSLFASGSWGALLWLPDFNLIKYICFLGPFSGSGP